MVHIDLIFTPDKFQVYIFVRHIMVQKSIYMEIFF